MAVVSDHERCAPAERLQCERALCRDRAWSSGNSHLALCPPSTPACVRSLLRWLWFLLHAHPPSSSRATPSRFPLPVFLPSSFFPSFVAPLGGHPHSFGPLPRSSMLPAWRTLRRNPANTLRASMWRSLESCNHERASTLANMTSRDRLSVQTFAKNPCAIHPCSGLPTNGIARLHAAQPSCRGSLPAPLSLHAGDITSTSLD